MSRLLIVGLTGQTGAGKSTVSRVFEEGGMPVIDCDGIARMVVEPGTVCLAELSAAFGKEIRLSNGALDRRKLSGIVFASPEKLQMLNQIIFPHITAEIRARLAALEQKGYKAALLDAPTLFESGADALCGLIVAVIADAELRFARIRKRDFLSEEAALARMSSQKSETFFRKHADFVIENNAGTEELAAAAKEVLAAIQAKGRHNGY